MTALIELYANNGYSVLAGALNDTSTTINLQAGTGVRFPNPVVGKQFFRLVITSASSPNTIFEIVFCTARSGDVLTVERGQEGTTAQAWAISDLLGNEPTAGMFNQFVQPWQGVDTGAVNAYVLNTPQHETALYPGMQATFTTLNANTSFAPTLNLNGLGAKEICLPSGGPILPGMVPAGIPVQVLYAASDDKWHLVTNFRDPLIQVTDGFASVAGTIITLPLEFPTGILQCQLTVKTSSGGQLGSNGPVGYQIIDKQRIYAFSVVGGPAVSVFASGY